MEGSGKGLILLLQMGKLSTGWCLLFLCPQTAKGAGDLCYQPVFTPGNMEVTQRLLLSLGYCIIEEAGENNEQRWCINRVVQGVKQ
jgi:hypothetical protein